MNSVKTSANRPSFYKWLQKIENEKAARSLYGFQMSLEGHAHQAVNPRWSDQWMLLGASADPWGIQARPPSCGQKVRMCSWEYLAEDALDPTLCPGFTC